jgi:hypothetical protein
MLNSLNNDFKFYIPLDLKKSKANKDSEGVQEMILEGLAGDGGSDSEGENLTYNNFDLDRMFYINWEHSKEPSDVIGVILNKELRKGGKLFIKGKLFSDHQKAKDAYQLQEFLEKEGHNLGFSVEGKVIERDPINPKVVRKAELYGVALCKVPVNPVTYARIAKAFTTGQSSDDIMKSDEEGEVEELEKMTTGDIAPAMPESVEKKPKNEKNKEFLTKSEVYIRIFNKFTSEPILADRIYSLIKSINNKMEGKDQEITEDVILKAEKILGLVTEKSAEDKPAEEIVKGAQADMNVAGDENGGEITTLQKAVEDAHSEYLKKAEAYKSMCKAKGIAPNMPDEKKEEPIEKGININLIKGAIVEVLEEKFGFVDRLEKSVEIRTQALGSLIVADRENITYIKEELNKANESTKLANEFIEDLRERLHVVERTPIKKAVTTENFKERFVETPKDGGKRFNIRSQKDREEISKSVEAVFGNDLENPENVKMLEAVATLQMTGTVEPHQQALLKSKGYELVQM